MLRAVLFDAAGATASTSTNVTVRRFKPRALRLYFGKRRAGRTKQRRRISGVVRRPSRVTARQGCRGGSVDVRVRRRGRTIVNVRLPLRRNCRFAKTIRLLSAPRGKRLKATGRFGGNTVLAGVTTKRRIL